MLPVRAPLGSHRSHWLGSAGGSPSVTSTPKENGQTNVSSNDHHNSAPAANSRNSDAVEVRPWVMHLPSEWSKLPRLVGACNGRIPFPYWRFRALSRQIFHNLPAYFFRSPPRHLPKPPISTSKEKRVYESMHSLLLFPRRSPRGRSNRAQAAAGPYRHRPARRWRCPRIAESACLSHFRSRHRR